MIKALIIDDDPIQLKLAELLIKRSASFGQSMSFTGAVEALAFLGNRENEHLLPDVILLDLNMPLVDGWTFLSRYAQIRPQMNKKINLFILSSSIDEKDILRSRGFQFVTGYFSKPMSPDILDEIVTHLN
jgi:two-component system, chemotaxis family, chemotaxis protein CheY